MPNSLQVHILYNSDTLVVSKSYIFKNELIDVASSSHTVWDCNGMRICHLNLVCVHFIWFVIAVDHAKTFRNISFIVHFLIVIN